MRQKTPRDVLDAAAKQHVSDKINLYPSISEKLEKKPIMQTLRTRPALAFIIAFLSISLLTSVAYALGRSLGYIPGVGVVEQSNGIYILGEPVSVKQAGIMVTVNRFVSDSTRTYIAYRVDGIPPVTSGFPICTDAPALRLSNGSVLNLTGGGAGGMESHHGELMSFETSYTFPPLPAQTKKVIFIPPCQMPVLELFLVPAPANFVTPATEIEVIFESTSPDFTSIATATTNIQPEAATPELHSYSLTTKPTSVPNGSGLYIDKVLETENSYILVGNFTDTGDLPGSLVISNTSDSFYRPKIKDANGEPVPFHIRQDIQPEIDWGGVYYWAYEIPKPITGPLLITLDYVNINQSSTFQFQFDTGPDPQLEQQWELNLPLSLGGYDYIIDQVEMLEKGYLVKWHSGIDVPEGTSFRLSIQNLSPSTTDGTWGMEDRKRDRVNYAKNFLTDEPVPSGILNFELTLYQTIPLSGPWTISWMPPNP